MFDNKSRLDPSPWNTKPDPGTKRRIRHHARAFLVPLTMMVYEFNHRYRDRLRGRMMYDARRPAQSPWFMIPEEILLEAIFGAKLTDQPLWNELQSPVSPAARLSDDLKPAR